MVQAPEKEGAAEQHGGSRTRLATEPEKDREVQRVAAERKTTAGTAAT
jgi:hypothetical protein